MHYLMDKTMVVVGIDPGTDTVGYSCGIMDTETGALELCSAITLYGGKMLKAVDHETMKIRYGNMISRLMLLGTEVGKMLDKECPDLLIIEDFFKGRGKSIQTFAALARAQQTFLMAAWMNVPLCDTQLIMPSIGKRSFGVPTNSGDKELMIAAVPHLVNTTYAEGLIEGITEHSADAVAQVYAYVDAYRKLHGLER